MSVYNIGEFIKEKRERMGVTQEELCQGICSLPTMSRIESGARMPKRETIIQIFQRLGIPAEMYPNYTTKADLEVLYLVYQVRQSYNINDMATAKELFSKLNGEYDNLPVPDKQFCRLFETVIKMNSGELANAQVLPELEDIMKMSCPNYNIDRLPRLMTFEEINVLNNIAICYAKMDKMDVAINIYYSIVGTYKLGVSNIEDSLRTSPTIHYNLSKYLGLSGRYDECIRICEDGIRYIKLSGNYRNYPSIMYNLAWVLVRRNSKGDMERAESVLKKAYYTSVISWSKSLTDSVRRLYKEYFNKDLPELT